MRTFIRRHLLDIIPLTIVLVTLALACIIMSGCAHQVPGETQKIVSCGRDSIKKCIGEVTPVVLGCLDAQVDVRACLIGAGSSGIGCLTFDTIACATREQRDVVPMRALMENGPTSVQIRRSSRAAEYIDKAGVTFDDGR